MPSLHQICDSALSGQLADSLNGSPLCHACSLPRTGVDHAPLPLPSVEAAFDSGWDVVFDAMPSKREAVTVCD